MTQVAHPTVSRTSRNPYLRTLDENHVDFPEPAYRVFVEIRHPDPEQNTTIEFTAHTTERADAIAEDYGRDCPVKIVARGQDASRVEWTQPR